MQFRTTSRRSVAESAKSYLIAKSKFLQAYRRYRDEGIEACSDEVGWKLMGSFRQIVENFSVGPGRPRHGTLQAIRQFFRLACSGEASYSFHEAAAFVKWYGTVKNSIVESIGHLYEHHDDCFDDLVDGLPLAGREFVERARSSHWRVKLGHSERFAFADEISPALLNSVGERWHHFIYTHETNIALSLRAACRKFYVLQVLDGKDEHVSWANEERSSLDFRREDYD